MPPLPTKVYSRLFVTIALATLPVVIGFLHPLPQESCYFLDQGCGSAVPHRDNLVSWLVIVGLFLMLFIDFIMTPISIFQLST